MDNPRPLNQRELEAMRKDNEEATALAEEQAAEAFRRNPPKNPNEKLQEVADGMKDRVKAFIDEDEVLADDEEEETEDVN